MSLLSDKEQECRRHSWFPCENGKVPNRHLGHMSCLMDLQKSSRRHLVSAGEGSLLWVTHLDLSCSAAPNVQGSMSSNGWPPAQQVALTDATFTGHVSPDSAHAELTCNIICCTLCFPLRPSSAASSATWRPKATSAASKVAAVAAMSQRRCRGGKGCHWGW